jgi:hypothetical protein
MAGNVCWTNLLIDPARRATGGQGVTAIGFPSRIDLILSDFEMQKGTEIIFPETQVECRVNAILFLSGQMEIHLGTGRLGHWEPGTACLLRSDTPGFRLGARESGWMAHVCISMACTDLAERFRDGPPAVLLDYLQQPGPVDVIRPLAISGPMSAAARALQDAALHDPFERSRCEPLALQFLLEALAALLLPDPVHPDDAAVLVEQAQALHNAVARDPSVGLHDVLGPGLSPRDKRMVLRMFEARYGESHRRFRQRTNMEIARSALLQGTVIKQLAYDLGYKHVANFSRAYSRAFGESPSKTLRRRLHTHGASDTAGE